MRALFRSLITPLTVSLFLGTSTTAAQDAAEAGASTPPAPRAVIDRFLAATNAKAVFEKTKSRREKGTFNMKAMGMEGSYEAVYVKPNIHVSMMEFGGAGSMTNGYDGKTAWSMNPMMGNRILDGMEAEQIRIQADYGSNLRDDSQYESMKNLGTETFEGKQCYKLELIRNTPAGSDAEKTKKSRTVIEFYEIETGLLIGNVTTQASPQGESESTTYISEYKKFGDLLVGTKMTIKMMMGEVERTVDTVEFDTVTDDDVVIPTEIAKLLEE